MAVATYRGFTLKSAGQSTEVWQVKIKNHILSGNKAAVKKSIDWWCDTASIIDPKEFSAVEAKREQATGMQEQFAGFTLKNDTGEPNGWYCIFNGRLIKGSKLAIEKHIEKTILELRQAKAAAKK
ncbi:DUF3319 domain-containing protein [Vibrio mangrovi]|uniref:DUF3319 domain-containing protein n=1 Tax=Vibrio mangrovi TaxID=474394 RepID=A0A1Y6ISW2_9VIBR|nr:DUF3319 domain-containing protein [Vibrio mangrovi]MDW6004433.1 DUF3319 domain-containing protein [Vibrio mangrovi]SMS00735.1 hypothetical protein VIM7927_02004 [Vibrio mangrovi]